MDAATPPLAVLIVTYQSRSDLPDCLDSLGRSTYKEYELIIVDNASTDGTAAWVKSEHPKAVLLPQSENLGFAAGNNIGLEYILEREFKQVLLLNPDTILSTDALAVLIRGASDTVVRQPLLLLAENGELTDKVNTAGNYLNFLGFSYVGGYRQERGRFKEKEGISLASGAAVCIPTAILRQVGLFCPYFFLYHEDADLSWRIRQAGFELELWPEAVVWHKYHFSRHRRKFFYNERNRLFFIWRCYQPRTLLLLLPFALVGEVLILAYAALNGWFLGKLLADAELLLNLPRILRNRREIAAKRKLSDHQLRKWFTADFRFSEVAIPGEGLFNLVSQFYWRLISTLI